VKKPGLSGEPGFFFAMALLKRKAPDGGTGAFGNFRLGEPDQGDEGISPNRYVGASTVIVQASACDSLIPNFAVTS
jgi:hypothetical protein